MRPSRPDTVTWYALFSFDRRLFSCLLTIPRIWLPCMFLFGNKPILRTTDQAIDFHTATRTRRRWQSASREPSRISPVSSVRTFSS